MTKTFLTIKYIDLIKSNQIKSLLLSHHHNTSSLVSEIRMSVLQTVQKKQTIYIWTVHVYCIKYCIKTNTTNSECYFLYSFFQASHLSILIYHWNTKSDGVDKFDISFTKEFT